VLIALPVAANAGVATTPAPLSATALHLQLSASAAVTGETLSATVRLVPRRADQIVVLQRKGSTTWRNVVVGTTQHNGQLTVNFTLRSAGRYLLRAAIGTMSGTAVAVSPRAVLTVSPPPAYAGPPLAPGATGADVASFQQVLSSLGYWVGTADGYYGDATVQAVYALQKAADLIPSGVATPATIAALNAGTVPVARPVNGYAIEVNLEKDLVLFVNGTQVLHVLNTSTGGGYTYAQQGATYVATTPRGVFTTARVVDGTVTDTLGTLWRPRFFYEGFAIHGDSYVPPVPVSHGCVRVSNEAIDWIWSANLDPIGTEVWIY
jgi:peptidoglycan hydrolase-like protein with peptidoglycan-binding domain